MILTAYLLISSGATKKNHIKAHQVTKIMRREKNRRESLFYDKVQKQEGGCRSTNTKTSKIDNLNANVLS